MTAQIIQKRILLRQAVYNIHLLLQKPHILGCHTIPCGSHGRYIVEHMAFRLLHRPKIRNYLFRLHHDLSEQHYARTYNLPDHTHHPHNRVHLRKIPALGSQLFPDIRNRINSDNIHSLIGKKQEMIHHFIKHSGISVIQIPLIGIKGRHHIMPDFRQISEIARCRGREHLRDRLLVSARYVICIIEEVPAHILALSLSCTDCPLMVFRSMIHDKIHTEIHIPLMTHISQLRQLLHHSQIRSDLSEIRHRIAPVGTSLRGIQKRH